MLTDSIKGQQQTLSAARLNENKQMRKRNATSEDSLLVLKGPMKDKPLLIDEDDEKKKRCLDLIKNAKKVAKETGTAIKLPLFTYNECPTFLQDNEYICTGYRCFYPFEDTWRSIFMVHNETGNIWTHLVGVVCSLALLGYMYFNMPEGSKTADYFAFAVYFISSGLCFLFSTLFHTHFVSSRQAFVQFGCLDYAGISSMICGASCLVAYFAWYCEPLIRTCWLALLVVVASIGIIGPLFDVWTTRAFRKFRTLIYVISGFLSGAPVFHFIISHGLPTDLHVEFYQFLIYGVLLYLIGAYIYAHRLPETWFPGKFDILFHSHQWWHVAVFTAFYLHYIAFLHLLDWRLGSHCSATTK